MSKTMRCRQCGEGLPPGAEAAELCPSCRSVDGATLDLPGTVPEVLKTTIKASAPPLARFGKYQLVRELGRGGMGVVYEALDSGLRRKVALKYMHAGAGDDSAEFRRDEERFLREARLCAGLPAHPHIVRVHEAGVIDGKRYLAMEFISGRSHAEWRKSGTIPLREQIRMLRDILLAIHHAHENGVIHRDLKPQNVIVDDSGAPHVLDFGLAKQAGSDLTLSLTASGMVLGTPFYMSPEQARGAKRVDRRTDVWSAGVMLYELLAGRLPFVGDSPFDVLMKVAKFEVVPPSHSASGSKSPVMDRALENICLKALAKRVEERYATSKDFALDLDHWLRGEAVRVVVPKRRDRRRIGLWALGAATLAVALLALVLGLRTPSVEQDLRQADAMMKESRYTEALLAYGRARAKDPSNGSAEAGERAARANLDRVRREDAEKVSEERKSLESRLAEQKENVRRIQEDLRKKGSAPTEELQTLQDRLKATELEARKSQEELALQKQEAADKLRAEASVLPSEDAWKTAIPLLPLMNPSDSLATGIWTRKDDELHSDASTSATLQAGYEPPEEYDFRIVFTRREGNADVSQILSRNCRTFLWVLGCERNTLAGFGLVNGRGLPDPTNPTTIRAAPILQNGRRHTSIVQVRAGGVKAWLDGRRVAEWKTDYSDLGAPKSLKLAPNSLGLSTWASPTTFHQVDLLEVTGKGRRATPSAPSFEKAVPLDGAALLPGLRGEYFRGRSFGTLAYRRTDRRILFDWGVQRGWPGGSWDDFSVRWTGFLQIPRTGRYRIQLRYDDGVRLILGGRVLIDEWKNQPEATALLTCDLEQGYHPLTLEYYEHQGDAKLTMIVRDAADGKVGEDGGDILYHQPLRLPVPAAASAADAEKSLRQEFRADLERRTGAGSRVLEEALRESRDPLRRYALLQLARTLFVESMDVAEVFRAADELAEGFDLKPLAVRSETFRLLRRQMGIAFPGRALAPVGFEIAEEALRQADFDGALAAARDTEDLCRMWMDPGMATAAADLGAEILELKVEADRATRAERALPVRPLDGDSALHLGRVLCFTRNDWKRGPEVLAKARDTGFRDAARLEAAVPATPAAQTALADAWAALAAKEKSSLQKRRCRGRAIRWYEEAESAANAGLQSLIRRKLQDLRSSASIDLLGMTDLRIDRLTGEWKRVGASLVSPQSATPLHAQFRIPVLPPDEYDLTLEVRREALRLSDASTTFDVTLSAFQTRFAVALGGSGGDYNFLYHVDGGLGTAEGSRWQDHVFPEGRDGTFVFRVRRSGLTVESNGAVVLRWGDYSRLSLSSIWKLAPETPLQVAAWTSCAYRITRLELAPVSGRVRPQR